MQAPANGASPPKGRRGGKGGGSQLSVASSRSKFDQMMYKVICRDEAAGSSA